MKNLMCLAVIFIFFVQIAVLPIEANIICETCQKTPNPPVCISSLQSDPRSATADIHGLAFIMIDLVKAKSTMTLNQINQLLKQSPEDKALRQCAEDYNGLVLVDIPYAYRTIKEGRAMFAEQAMNDGVIEANGCEDGFAGESTHPLTQLNKVVVEAIIREF